MEASERIIWTYDMSVMDTICLIFIICVIALYITIKVMKAYDKIGSLKSEVEIWTSQYNSEKEAHDDLIREYNELREKNADTINEQDKEIIKLRCKITDISRSQNAEILEEYEKELNDYKNKFNELKKVCDLLIEDRSNGTLTEEKIKEIIEGESYDTIYENIRNASDMYITCDGKEYDINNIDKIAYAKKDKLLIITSVFPYYGEVRTSSRMIPIDKITYFMVKKMK